MVNRDEFLTGTNPTNQYSKLMITAMDSPPSATSQVVMAWSSVTNIFYSVSVRPAFTGVWQVLQTRLPATPPENVSTVDVSTAGAVTGLFLRVTGD
jgi:hypothetical protein